MSEKSGLKGWLLRWVGGLDFVVSWRGGFCGELEWWALWWVVEVGFVVR